MGVYPGVMRFIVELNFSYQLFIYTIILSYPIFSSLKIRQFRIQIFCIYSLIFVFYIRVNFLYKKLIYIVMPILLKDLLLKENEYNDSLKSVKILDKDVLLKMAKAAQDEYDGWVLNDKGYDEEVGGGGICHLIADSMGNVLNSLGIEYSSVCATDEQHVYLVGKFSEGVYIIDIPYSIYETGGGFSWKKIPNIKFDTTDIVINKIDGDPDSFNMYVDSV